MQNFMDLDIEKISDPKALTFEVWGLKTSLWQFGPKFLCNGLIKPLEMRTLASIFKNRTSFSQESWDESNKIMRSQKIYWPWGLGPKNYIWANWARKTSSCKSRTLAPIFTNKTVSQELWGKSSKIVKPQKDLLTLGPGG